MVVKHISEPKLEFGNGIHVDIRFGLMNLGPQDLGQPRRPEKIKVGVVGTSKSIEGCSSWLERCAKEIPGKESQKPNLFPHFPGFNEESTFCSSITLDASLVQTVTPRDFSLKNEKASYEDHIRHAVDCFRIAIESLSEKRPDVVFVAMPGELLELFAKVELKLPKVLTGIKLEFHDLLKGSSMTCGVPIQLIRPSTWGEKLKTKEKDEQAKQRSTQDEATRAWNALTALYYKAGGFPYRVPRPETALDTCYIGVSFFVSPDKSRVQTSVANVFNERGHGLAVKGKEAVLSKDDRTPHLKNEDAHELLTHCLKAYRLEHKRPPARIVVHKSSRFSDGERLGFLGAAEEAQIDYCDLLSLSRSRTRLFRKGYYPPLRGTWLQQSIDRHSLYTRGSVDFYQEYPGMYVPRTLGVEFSELASSPEEIMTELLVLSKTNWNNTQMDATMPITISAARRVGEILRWIPSDSLPEKAYRFFM